MSQTVNIEEALVNSVIEFAVDNSLVDSNNKESLALEGVAFNPDKQAIASGTFSGLYIECNFLPSSSTGLTLGNNSKDREIGVFQITVYQKTGNGVNFSNELVKLIENYWARLNRFVYNDVLTTVTSVVTNPRLNNGGWIQTPVSIEYHAFTKRST